MFASTLKKTNKIWYDEIYKYMILGKGVHFNPQSVKGYILDIWYLSLLYFILKKLVLSAIESIHVQKYLQMKVSFSSSEPSVCSKTTKTELCATSALIKNTLTR